MTNKIMKNKLSDAGSECIALDKIKPTNSAGKSFNRGEKRRAMREAGTMKFQLGKQA